jgi:hypothetical protein
MAKGVRVDKLGAVLEQQLTIYGEEVNEKITTATAEAMDKLVRITKATAPKGASGSFRKSIASDSKQLTRAKRSAHGGLHGRVIKSTWYVKAPDYRLTHLLVHGHATKDGGRTKANPFLQNALDTVLPEYEAAVEEAIKK